MKLWPFLRCHGQSPSLFLAYEFSAKKKNKKQNTKKNSVLYLASAWANEQAYSAILHVHKQALLLQIM